MKKTLITLALATLMTSAFVACQPEEIEVTTLANEQTLASTIRYTVDGEPYTSHEELPDIISQLFVLVNEGHAVHIYPTSDNDFTIQTKGTETVIFTTSDESEARNWAIKMNLHGHQVDISKDQATGIYTCIATK